MPGDTAVETRRGRLGALLSRERKLAALAAMAVAGFAISIYLTTVHYTKLPLICPANTLINCARVTSSAYSVVPGTQLPITIPGMLWFAVSGGLAGLALVRAWRARPEPERLRLLHLLWGAAGLLFVLYLVFCEIVLLHQLCEWCTVVHLLTLATVLVALSRWQEIPATASLARPAARRTARSAPPRAPVSTRSGGTRPSTGSRRQPASSARSHGRKR